MERMTNLVGWTFAFRQQSSRHALCHQFAESHAFRNAAVLWIVETGVGDLQPAYARHDRREFGGKSRRAYGLSMTQAPDMGRDDVVLLECGIEKLQKIEGFRQECIVGPDEFWVARRHVVGNINDGVPDRPEVRKLHDAGNCKTR